MRILILGPQGSGKGTQAKRIAAAYGVPHVATGDIFRAAVSDGSALGVQVAPILATGGLVVSEYEPGVEPAPWRFPARNRVIAGLAAATVVVEARERSGALITADFALEDGREVLAEIGRASCRERV